MATDRSVSITIRMDEETKNIVAEIASSGARTLLMLPSSDTPIDFRLGKSGRQGWARVEAVYDNPLTYGVVPLTVGLTDSVVLDVSPKFQRIEAFEFLVGAALDQEEIDEALRTLKKSLHSRSGDRTVPLLGRLSAKAVESRMTAMIRPMLESAVGHTIKELR